MVGTSADADVVRPQTVHQLVHQDVREERIEGDVLPVVSRERHLRDRLKHRAKLRLLVILQHHALRALLRNHALVVGQVERRRLHAAIAIAGRKDGVDDANRRESPKLRVAILRIDRQVVLDLLQLRSKPHQLLSLRVVAKRDERFERRLVVEPLVLVDLVRADRRLDAGVKLHPRDVAVVVVVAQEAGARFSRKFFSVGCVVSAAASRSNSATCAISP